LIDRIGIWGAWMAFEVVLSDRKPM